MIKNMTVRPPADDSPFIRIVGEVNGSRTIEVGDEISWSLSLDPLVPRGSKEGFFYSGRVVEPASGRIVKRADTTPIVFQSQEEDFGRFAGENRNRPVDYRYLPFFRVDDLPDGEYCASVEMLRGYKIVATDQLTFLKGATRAVLSRRIKLPCPGGLPRTGDLDGDGKLEFVHTVNAQHQTAFDNTGGVMWEFHDPDGALIYNTAPTRVFDINADGKAEILCMRGAWGAARLCLIEGGTGRVLKEIEWPHINKLIHPQPGSEEHARFRYETGHAHRWIEGRSMYGAKIAVTNLQGNATPQDFICQTGEQNKVILTAFNNRLEKLWEHKTENGYGGHNPWPGDINDDGKDEVAVGTQMLDSDGNVLWERELEDFAPPWEDDHMDGMRIEDVDDDGRVEVIYTARAVADALTGRIKWSLPTIHGQEVNVIKMRDDVPGKQIVICDRTYRAHGSLVYGTALDVRDCFGRPLWRRPRMCLHMARELDWDGDGRNEIIIGFDLPRKPFRFNAGIFDGRGRLIGVLPRSGFGAPLCGRRSDDLISWTQWPDDADTLEVYTNAAAEASETPPLPKKISYNEQD